VRHCAHRRRRRRNWYGRGVRSRRWRRRNWYGRGVRRSGYGSGVRGGGRLRRKRGGAKDKKRGKYKVFHCAASLPQSLCNKIEPEYPSFPCSLRKGRGTIYFSRTPITVATIPTTENPMPMYQ
jgi:hypothetical protein